MAVFKLENFAGIAPAKSPRLLNTGLGQTAHNMTFDSGRLTPMKADLRLGSFGAGSGFTGNLVGSTKSIAWYDRVGDTPKLFQFEDSGVKFLESPIPEDSYERGYWTGDDYPRMGTYTSMVSGSLNVYPSTSFRLGIPAPTARPGVTKAGTASTTESVEDFSYVYTLVSDYGEEGPPSPPSNIISWTSPETITISTPQSASAFGSGYSFANGKKRIYRANAGSNAAYFQFVAEIPFANTSLTDNRASAGLGEVLPSEGWVGPPNDDTSLYPDGPMQGLIAVGNGVFCGYAGKRLCFSEPYLPHAWPVQYRITIEEEIMGLSATNNGVVVMTKGFPYFVTGTDPAAMTAVQVDVAQSCLNTDSIVDMGEYVLYSGPDGLVQVSNTTGQVISKEFISPKQWNSDFYASTYKAFLYEGVYVAFWSSGSNHGGWIFDPRRPETAFSTFEVNPTSVRGGITQKSTGELFFIAADNLLRIIQFKAGGPQVRGSAKYKSRVFISQPTSMAAIKIVAQDYPVEFKVYADGVLIAQQEINKNSNGRFLTQASTLPANADGDIGASPIARLPANHGTEWEVEIISDYEVDEVTLASTIAELNA